jgi:hypothetical protein
MGSKFPWEVHLAKQFDEVVVFVEQQGCDYFH